MTAQQVFRNTVIVIATVVTAYVLLLSLQIIVVLMIAIIIASAVRPIGQMAQPSRTAAYAGDHSGLRQPDPAGFQDP